MKKNLYAIWSFRHSQWWKFGRQGYTPKAEDAGIYTTEEAADIALGGLPGANIPVDAVLFRQMQDSTPAGVEARLDELRRI